MEGNTQESPIFRISESSPQVELKDPEINNSSEDDEQGQLSYGLEDTPPWYLSLMLGIQHYLTMVGGTITIPFILTPMLCIDNDDPARGLILCTILFVSGIVTLLQCTFGIRLPIVQGATFGFLLPAMTILSTTFPPCEEYNITSMTDTEREDLWQDRMTTIQGAITVASVFQVVIGCTGIIGALMMWITPLAIVPTIALVGLSLFSTAVDKAGKHWGISSLTIVLVIIFSQYMKNIGIPLVTYSKGKYHTRQIKLFSLFPVLLGMGFSWGLCAILTVTDTLDEGNPARTDLQETLLIEAPWFRVPYPCQWGVPQVTVSGVFGMLAGVLSSIFESIGDYYACARMCNAPPPPTHAINRAVTIEGLGCILAGLWGSGTGLTSYSENIGAIGVTKVGSRRVIQYGAAIMIIFGTIGKFGALFVTIPEPVIGGVFCIMFSIITAVGLSSLQFVDLNSSRNLFVLGFSIFIGLALPTWLENNPGVIKTGDDIVDQIITVLLQTSMFVGGMLGFFLDNTIPGTDKERGMDKWKALVSGSNISNQEQNDNNRQKNDVTTNNTYCSYDMPFGMDVLRRNNWTSYIPISPTFRGWRRKK